MPKPDQQVPHDELGCSSDVVALIKRMEAINHADAKLVRLLQEDGEAERLEEQSTWPDVGVLPRFGVGSGLLFGSDELCVSELGVGLGIGPAVRAFFV